MISATPKRFSLDEYHRLAKLGFLSQDDRVELIKGEIIQMAAKGTSHSVCNSRLLHNLVQLVAERAIVRCQEPISLPPNSEPEADFAIVCQRSDNYLSAHPGAVDVLLVIEVADSSLSYDQTTKLALYAESGISDYWIFNLVTNCLETYSEPYQDEQRNFSYRNKRIALRNDSVIVPSFTDLLLDLSKVFPHS